MSIVTAPHSTVRKCALRNLLIVVVSKLSSLALLVETDWLWRQYVACVRIGCLGNRFEVDLLPGLLILGDWVAIWG